MRKVAAYAFKTPYSLETIQGKLKANTSWTWHQRLNDTYGEYLMARPLKDYARLRIFPRATNCYILDALYESETSTGEKEKEWSNLTDAIRGQVLSVIAATEVVEREPFD
jgi:hypothetical protein